MKKKRIRLDRTKRCKAERAISGIKILLLCISVMLTCSGCGNAADNLNQVSTEGEMGRYVEEEVEPEGGEKESGYAGLVQQDGRLRLIGQSGGDWVSDDHGASFTSAEDGTDGQGEASVELLSVTGSSDGSRILMEYIDGVRRWRLTSAEGEEIISVNLGENEYPSFYSGADCFYMKMGSEIYRIHRESGEIQFLTENENYPLALAANDEMLFILHVSGVSLFDLNEKNVAEKQDEVLSGFFSQRQDDILNDISSVFLYPCGEELYVLTHEGIFVHELYGSEMRRVVDGSACGIGDIGRGFLGMTVTEAEGEKIFNVLYTDGKLLRYVKDKSLPAEPEASLRIYSLYDDGNIRQAVSAFRRKYPELYIKYEVGVNPDYGGTEEDALRNLGTELAAGTGPDILVVDDIPFDTYGEKGILADLSFLRDDLPEEEYFETVAEGFATESGLYVMPLTFALPVLAVDSETAASAGEIKELSQLADLVEKTAGGEESVIGFLSAEEALRLFAQSSMGAWETEEGTLDRNAVAEFLTQLKRIYDVQMRNLPENMNEMFFSGSGWGSGENTLARRCGSYGLSETLDVKLMAFPEQPFCGGYLSGAAEDFPMTLGKLKHMGGEYMQMPGQSYGTCLPATLMAMNSASKHGEESRLFLEYIFSSEFQGNVSLNGTPVNKGAFLQRQENPKGESTEHYAAMGYAMSDGSVMSLQINWPSKEDFARLESLADHTAGVNYCDNRIYGAVIKLGQAALTGEAGIEETVDAIEKELELYLAE